MFLFNDKPYTKKELIAKFSENQATVNWLNKAEEGHQLGFIKRISVVEKVNTVHHTAYQLHRIAKQFDNGFTIGDIKKATATKDEDLAKLIDELSYAIKLGKLETIKKGDRILLRVVK